MQDQNFQLTIRRFLCAEGSILEFLCRNTFAFVSFSVGNAAKEQLNAALIREILKVAPAGGSMRIGLQVAQNYRKADFRRFDFGRSHNLRVYGQGEPPAFKVALGLLPHLQLMTFESRMRF